MLINNLINIFMEKAEQKIENQELDLKIQSLFSAKVHQQNKCKSLYQNSHFCDSHQTIQFYGKFEEQIKHTKFNLLLLLQEKLSQLTIDEAHRLRIKISPLLRDPNILLDEGIFDYLFQIANLIQEQQSGKLKDIAQKILDISTPIIKKYFIHKQYLRIKDNYFKGKKQNYQRRNSQHRTSNRKTTALIKIQDIQDFYQPLPIQQLIQKHLEKQQQSMEQTLQICRLCSIKVKLGSLLSHLQFCQKRQSLKKKIKQIDARIKQLLFEFQKMSFIQEVNSDKTEQTISLHRIIKKILKNSQQRFHNYRRASGFSTKQSIFNVSRDIEEFTQKFGIQGSLVRYEELSKQKQVLLNQIQILYKKQNQRSDSCNSFRSCCSRQSQSKEKSSNLLNEKYKKSNFIEGKSCNYFDQQTQQTQINQIASYRKDKNSDIKMTNESANKSFARSQGSNQSNQSISENQQNEIVFENQRKQAFKNDVSCIQTKNFKNFVNIFNSQKEQNKKQARGKENNFSSSHQRLSIKPSRFQSYRKNQKKTTIFQLLKLTKQEQIEQDKQLSERNASSYTDMPVCQDQSYQQALKLDNFQFLSFLGKGAFGKVYLARRKNTLDLYAVKMIIIQQSWGDKQMRLIKNEYQTFKHTGSNHLVKAPFAFSSRNGFFFVMQYMPGGDLGQLLAQEVYLQQKIAKFYLAEIVLAIEHLHQYKVIHRDLKPQNLVFDADGHLKLTDFGLSETRINDKIEKVKRESDKYQMELQDKVKNRNRRGRRSALVTGKHQIRLIGTPDYIAPEIINGTSATNQSIDWWSFGVIAYEIIIGVRPFAGDTIQEVINNIVSYSIQWPQVGYQEGMITPEAKDLILKLTERNYMNRLGANGADEIKSHPFFKQIDWKNIKSINPPLNKKKQIGIQIYDKKEDQLIRKQIQAKIGYNSERGSTQSGKDSTPSKSISKFRLSNFVRYDILHKETFNSAQKVMKQKSNKIKKLRSLMDNLKPKEQQIVQVQQNKCKQFKQHVQEQYKSFKSIHLTKDQII